jgi:type IV secretory pathway TrbL component
MFGELMGSAEGLMSLLVILFMLAMGIGMGVWFFLNSHKSASVKHVPVKHVAH